MAEAVVFHHALGLTDPSAVSPTDSAPPTTPCTPDLYDGRTFHTIDDGMVHSDELGGPMAIVDRARAAVASLPSEAVYIGFSLGVLSAQALAQTRPGARGAVLCYSALPLGECGDNWPARWPNGVRLQLHILDGDEDFEIAQRLVATVSGAELLVLHRALFRRARRAGGCAAHGARARLPRGKQGIFLNSGASERPRPSRGAEPADTGAAPGRHHRDARRPDPVRQWAPGRLA